MRRHKVMWGMSMITGAFFGVWQEMGGYAAAAAFMCALILTIDVMLSPRKE